MLLPKVEKGDQAAHATIIPRTRGVEGPGAGAKERRDEVISPEDYIEDLLERYPGINAFLRERGVVCIQCGEPVWGTLREQVEAKGLDLDALVKDLNETFCPGETES